MKDDCQSVSKIWKMMHPAFSYSCTTVDTIRDMAEKVVGAQLSISSESKKRKPARRKKNAWRACVYGCTTKWVIVVQLNGLWLYDYKGYSCTTKGCMVVQLKGVWLYDYKGCSCTIKRYCH